MNALHNQENLTDMCGTGTMSLMAYADIVTIGIVESCLHCSHISPTIF